MDITEQDLEIGIMGHIQIKRKRWFIEITVTSLTDSLDPTTFVASADSFFTDHDHIWFGPKKEYDEAEL